MDARAKPAHDGGEQTAYLKMGVGCVGWVERSETLGDGFRELLNPSYSTALIEISSYENGVS